MKAIILKPVVWNSKNYIKPSGHKATSGFAKKYGYGHEEWNNSPQNIWREQRVFHTEATEKLYEYSTHGNLGIIPIASYNNAQYALGIATNVINNSKDEMEIIAEELNIFERQNELWKIKNIKKCFQNDRTKFITHWKQNYQWILWRCPLEHFYWFKHPILLNPKKITGKQRVTSMHGRFQAITPLIAFEIVKKHLPEDHQSLIWLTTGEFDEEIYKNVPENKKITAQKIRKKFKVKTGNAPAEESFEYWVAGKRTVNPHHATLQAKFVNHLRKQNIKPIENQDFIDVQYLKNGKVFFSEIKPTETVESKYAIRAAIGQLLEYHFLSKKDASLEIVIGTKPKKREIEFVKSINMIITYYDKEQKTFITA
jgi:hypothetical protein